MHYRFWGLLDSCLAAKDEDFALNFNEGYQVFKIGVMLKEAREAAGITQEELAIRLSTKKSAISRMENHAEDIKLSTRKNLQVL